MCTTTAMAIMTPKNACISSTHVKPNHRWRLSSIHLHVIEVSLFHNQIKHKTSKEQHKKLMGVRRLGIVHETPQFLFTTLASSWVEHCLSSTVQVNHSQKKMPKQHPLPLVVTVHISSAIDATIRVLHCHIVVLSVISASTHRKSLTADGNVVDEDNR